MLDKCFFILFYFLLPGLNAGFEWLTFCFCYRGFPVWLKYVPGISFRTDNEPFKVFFYFFFLLWNFKPHFLAILSVLWVSLLKYNNPKERRKNALSIWRRKGSKRNWRSHKANRVLSKFFFLQRAMQGFTQKIVQMMKNEKLFASQGGPIILSQVWLMRLLIFGIYDFWF